MSAAAEVAERPPGHAPSAVTDGMTGVTYPCCRCGWRGDPITVTSDRAVEEKYVVAWQTHAAEVLAS